MEEQAAITTSKLSKRYGSSKVFALKDLSISVSKGEIYGFLGPNGAGKSTTIRMLLNFIQPTNGSAHILGKDIVKDSVAIRRSIGYLAGDFAAYDKMTGTKFIEYMNSLQPPKRKHYAPELAGAFKLNLHKKIGELSKGNKQKMGIIQAFMHEPDIYILDEPTDGLDPLMQETFYSLVRSVKSKGATVFISSHNLAEVRKMCDRVGIIKDGLLVNESTIADLAEAAAQTFQVTFGSKAPTLSTIKAITGVGKAAKHSDGSIHIHVHGNLKPLLSFLAKQDVKALTTKEFDLETEFMKYYNQKGTR